MKKNFSLKFVSMAMAAALLAAPGCKDYDDDVKNLRELTAGVKSDLDALKSALDTKIGDVNSKVAEVKRAADEAKTAVENAKREALEAVGNAKKAAEDKAKAAQDRADEAMRKLEDAERKATQLRNDLNALKGRVDDLQTKSMTKEEFAKEKQALENSITAVSAEVLKFVGNRVTSISLLPTTHTNGIASLVINGVTYVPQKLDPKHQPFSFATKQATKEVVYMAAKGTGLFRLSPSSVTKESFTMPSIEAWRSSNDLRSEQLWVNEPVKPIAYELNGNILEVDFEKAETMINQGLNPSEVWMFPYHQDPWCQGEEAKIHHEEEFWMAALSLPISDKFRTEDEKKNAIQPNVISEGFRLEEAYVAPVIKSKIATGKEIGFIYSENGTPAKHETAGVVEEHHDACYDQYHPYAYDDTKSARHYYPAQNPTLTWGLPTHFSDSVLLYTSELDHLVDIDLEWNKEYDLMNFVTAATVGSHEDFDYKKHGLGFHFELAKKPYLKGPKNKTDQQQFATLNGSIISSKVYTVDGATETAVGREPIIRITLYDLKTKNVVDQRYMKIKWAKMATIKDLGETSFEDVFVSCKPEYIRLNTQKMNEDIYRRVEALGISKAAFTDRYTRLEIEHLTKDGEYLVKDGKYVAEGYEKYNMTSVDESANVPPVYRDLMLYYIPEDQEDPATPGAVNAGNTSFNVVWGLAPKVIRTLAEGGKSDFVLTFKFVDRLGETHLRYNFKVAVKLPMQEFNYEKTYWTTGKMGTEFKVNPLVYTPKDKTGADTRKAAQADYDDVDYTPNHFFAHGGSASVQVGDSHIQADLVNGFLYTRGEGAAKTSKKPENLGQFIQYIRSCAKVSFQFDADRFGEKQFAYLDSAKYVVSADGTQLWRGGKVGTANDKNFTQADNNYAASILNFLSVTADTNSDKNTTRPWDRYKEAIDNTGYARSSAVVDEARAIIRLHEADIETGAEKTDSDKGTAAAIELVGKNVPVKLVVEYNKWNKVAVKKFDVHFITPLKVAPFTFTPLVDAQIGGSFTKSSDLSYTDWNYQRVKNDPAVKWDQELWKYYAVKSMVFHVKDAKTSLQIDENGNKVHVEDYKEGTLPAGRMLQQVVVDSGNSEKDYVWRTVEENPTHLRYHNANGTPVNETYYIYLNVSSEYKWGVVGGLQKIEVKPAKGTNDPATTSRRK